MRELSRQHREQATNLQRIHEVCLELHISLDWGRLSGAYAPLLVGISRSRTVENIKTTHLTCARSTTHRKGELAFILAHDRVVHIVASSGRSNKLNQEEAVLLCELYKGRSIPMGDIQECTESD